MIFLTFFLLCAINGVLGEFLKDKILELPGMDYKPNFDHYSGEYP